jgi:hypothetical protein
MRACLTVVLLCVAVLVPRKGNAQAYFLPTPAPLATAASADWQIHGEPVSYSGHLFYPTGPNVFFDGDVMVRADVYRGVSLYRDVSLDPVGVLYVPIGNDLMRPYERLRSGDLAGTVGNLTPSFPIELAVEVSAAAAGTEISTPALPMTVEPTVPPESESARRAIGTGGAVVERSATDEEPVPVEGSSPGNTIVESIPPPTMNRGIWIEFEGARWYSAGPAVPFSADRFMPTGDHRGFPVYRDKAGKSDEIFIAAAKDGPVAPYKR